MRGQATSKLNWRLPVFGLLGALIVFLPKVILGNDIGAFLGMALMALVVGMVLLIAFLRTMRHQSLAALSMAVVFLATSWLLFRISDDIRTTGRWLVQAGRFKAAVLSQPNTMNGELKHAEWDGWGFAGVGDTTVYLVFDPADSLAAPAKSHSPGKYRGIPCQVLRVRRLESHWYTVLFYTETDWSHCG